MRSTAQTASAGQIIQWARFGLIACALLFATGAVAQVFLAGLSVFDSANYWSNHVDLGRMLGMPALLLPILALVERVGIRIGVMALAVTVLYVLQMMLANLDSGTVAALHAVNALALIGSAAQVGTQTVNLVRSRA